MGERERQRGEGGEQQLHPPPARDRVGGGDKKRQPHAVGLVQGPLGHPPVRLQLVRVEAPVLPPRVLVAQVHVGIRHERLGGEQVVGLIAAVVGVGERVQAERGRVGAQEDEEEGEGPSHGRAPEYQTVAWDCGLRAPVARVSFETRASLKGNPFAWGDPLARSRPAEGSFTASS